MPAAAGNSQSFTLNGLTPGLTYYFALKTADETNNVSPLSNVPGATTASTAPGGTAILIASNSVWKYLDNGSNQGTAWRGLTFNDAAWPSAAATFGYGIGGEATIVNYGPNAGAKYITTYFRRAFNVAAPSIYTNVLIQLMRDDGAVVYVNGLEVYRSNMATNGPINYLSLAAQDVTGSGSTRYYTKNVSPTNLIAGANVLAVELHQSSGASSDLRFNLQLTASSGCGSGGTELSPTLSIQRQGTNVTIRWPVTCATYVLEQSSSLGALAAWSSVSGSLNVVNGQNQMTAPASASGRFYRLRGM
jgi:hypothetical protein